MWDVHYHAPQSKFAGGEMLPQEEAYVLRLIVTVLG